MKTAIQIFGALYRAFFVGSIIGIIASLWIMSSLLTLTEEIEKAAIRQYMRCEDQHSYLACYWGEHYQDYSNRKP